MYIYISKTTPLTKAHILVFYLPLIAYPVVLVDRFM